MSEMLCEACGEPVLKGQLVYADADGGELHAACLGFPGEVDPTAFIDFETGEHFAPGRPAPLPHISQGWS